jgi:hypothetical protein
VLLAVTGLLFATAGGTAARTRKIIPSTVEITSVSGGTIEGVVASSKTVCVDRRKVFVKHDDLDLGFTKADEDGFWSIAATETVVQDDVIKAKIKETKVSGTNKSCAGDKDSFVATAEPVEHELAVNPTGPGKVDSDPAGISNCRETTGDCDAIYGDGVSVTLTATPDTGQTFTGWGGECTGVGTCNVQMNGNKVVTATFTASGGEEDTCPVPTDVIDPIRGVLCLVVETLGG